MALEDIVSPGYFYANDPNASLALRERIALQMLANSGASAKGKGYPKNIGEGLTAIGDALGEMGIARRLQAIDAAANLKTQQEKAAGPPATEIPPKYDTSANDQKAADASQDDEQDAADVVAPVTRNVASAASVPDTVPDNTPVRTNPDGTIAGNLTQPSEPPGTPPQPDQTTTPDQVPAAVPAATAAPPYNPQQRAQMVARIASILTPAAPPSAAPAVPQSNPILAGQVPASLRNSLPLPASSRGGQLADARLASLDPNAAPPSSIVKAPAPPLITTPPAAQPVRVAQAVGKAPLLTPEQQYAQPKPPAASDYVMPGVALPRPTPQTPQSAREQWAQDQIEKHPGDAYAAQVFGQIVKEEQEKRLYIDAQNKARDNKMLDLYGTLGTTRQEQIASQAQRAATYGTDQARMLQEQAKVGPALQAAELANRTGMPAEQAQAHFDALKTTAQKDVFTLQQLSLARDALNRGVVSGAGANMKLNVERYKAWLASDPRAAALASNSEQFLAAMKSTIANALQNVQPGDTRVTNADQMLAMGMVGGDVTNQLNTQRRLIDISTENVRKRLGDYEDLKDHYLSGLPMEKMYDVHVNPLHPDPNVEKAWVDKLIKFQNDPAAIARFNQEFGPGAAELEIARAKRRDRRTKLGNQ